MVTILKADDIDKVTKNNNLKIGVWWNGYEKYFILLLKLGQYLKIKKM